MIRASNKKMKISLGQRRDSASYLNHGNLSLMVGVSLSTLAGLLVWQSFSGLLEGPFFRIENFDKWFDSDVFRVISSMLSTETKGSRSNLHPVFPILSYVLTALVNFVIRDPVVAIQSLMSFNAFFATMLLWRLLNWLRLDLADIFLCLSLFIASASFVFWFPIVETFPIGATSMLLSLQLLTLSPAREARSLLLDVLLCSASLAITISNWIVGLTAIALRCDFHKRIFSLLKTSPRDYLQRNREALYYPIKVILLSGLAVSILSIIQDFAFEHSVSFLRVDQLDQLIKEKWFIDFRGIIHLATRIIELILNPMVVGEIVSHSYPTSFDQSGWVFDEVFSPKWRPVRDMQILSANSLSIKSMSQFIGVSTWLLLLAISAKNILQAPRLNPIIWTSIITLASFFALHALYGHHLFLYSAHFVFFYIIISSTAFQCKRKWIPRTLMFLLILSGGYHNYTSFELANTILLEISGSPM